MRVSVSKVLISILVYCNSVFSQVGIGTDSPDPSAILQVQSSSQGFLMPRVTKEERNNINNPATGLMIYNTDQQSLNLWVGYWRNLGANSTTVSSTDIYSPLTGLVWMNRNLGANQVASAVNDVNAYGDLYQWGRAKEGHESRTSSTYNAAVQGNAEASTATPNSGGAWDGDFIIEAPFGWLAPPDDDLWQGVNGENNPCPNGYRLPTEAEWLAESSNWNNPQDAFESVLKLSAAGYRVSVSDSNLGLTAGDIEDVGVLGNYWSSTIDGPNEAKLLVFISVPIPGSFLFSDFRSLGASVRCIKD